MMTRSARGTLIGRAVAQRTLVGLVLLVTAGSATASDQGITGKKLLLTPSKFMLISRDPSIDLTGSDPVGGSDSSITFDDGVIEPVPFVLPKPLWSGASTLFKFKNPDAPDGMSQVKVAKIKPGLLKVVGKLGPYASLSGPTAVDVVVSLDGGTNRYCMTFAGTASAGKLFVKDGAAGTCRPPGTPVATATASATPTATYPPCPSSGESVGGFCWYLGEFGASCDATCAGLGKTCSAGTVTYAGTGGTSAQCDAVLSALIPDLAFVGDQTCGTGGIGCAILFIELGKPGLRCSDTPTDCAAMSFETFSRACACQ